jgi:hypothetical protein
MMDMASNGHTLTQMPHPMHKLSDMNAIFESWPTSIHSLPMRTTGQDFLHSCLHFFGLQRSLFMIAILVKLSCSLKFLLFLALMTILYRVYFKRFFKIPNLLAEIFDIKSILGRKKRNNFSSCS